MSDGFLKVCLPTIVTACWCMSKRKPFVAMVTYSFPRAAVAARSTSIFGSIAFTKSLAIFGTVPEAGAPPPPPPPPSARASDLSTALSSLSTRV